MHNNAYFDLYNNNNNNLTNLKKYQLRSSTKKYINMQT